MKHAFLYFLLVALLQVQFAMAKSDRYRITLTIHNTPDTVMYMGYYYAENSYILDTAHIDRKGRFVFSSESRSLFPGMYFFSASSTRWMDFVVYNEKPFFSFTTDERDWIDNMTVRGSVENEILFNYKRGSNRIYDDYVVQMQSADSADRPRIHKEMERRQRDLKSQYIREYPTRMISLVMRSTSDIAATVPTHAPDGDSLSQHDRYTYFMEHYFDSMPLHDDMLVHTPKSVFYQRVMDYYDVFLKSALPETIIYYTDRMIEKARPSKENFKWLVHTVKEKFLHSNITLYEAVVVHMVKTYYASGDAYWCSASTIDEMTTLAEKWDRLLIGRTAPELILFDSLHVPHSLHHLPNRYKLLVFWSPTCGHCKTVIPELYERYKLLSQEYDIGTFAILSEPDDATRVLWHRFIARHHLDWLNLDGGEANIDWHDVYDVVTTPQIYLLDEHNTIIAKKLGADTFERVVRSFCHPKSEPYAVPQR